MPYYRDSRHTDIVIIVDPALYARGYIDIAGFDWRMLADAVDPSLRPGDFDYVVLHPFPLNESGAHLGGEDRTGRTAPLRGFVRMPHVGSLPWSATVVQLYLATLAQELGHYWGMPPVGATFADVGSEESLSPPDVVDFVFSAFRGMPFPRMPLRGRENTHWSTYLNGLSSPFEAATLILTDAIDDPLRVPNPRGRYVFGTTLSDPFLVPTPMGGPIEARLIQQYNPYELRVMGLLPISALVASGYEMFYLQPEWVVPMNFMSGLVVIQDSGSFIYFGFAQSFEKVAATRSEYRRSDGSRAPDLQTQPEDISTFYRPWDNTFMEFRLIFVREDIATGYGRYYCQYRIGWPPAGGDILVGMGDVRPGDASMRPPPGHAEAGNWVTAFELADEAPPLAAGYSTRTWGGLHDRLGAVDAMFRPLTVLDDNGRRTIDAVDRVPATPWGAVLGGDVPHPGNSVPPENVWRHGIAELWSNLRPDEVKWVGTRGGPGMHPFLRTEDRGTGVPFRVIVSSHQPTLPNPSFVGSYDSNALANEAPMLLTRFRGGTAVVAGGARLQRCVMMPFAAGDAAGTAVYGRRHRIDLSRVGLGSSGRTVAFSAIRALFAIVVPDDGSAMMVQSQIDTLELLRQSSETCMRALWGGIPSVSFSLP